MTTFVDFDEVDYDDRSGPVVVNGGGGGEDTFDGNGDRISEIEEASSGVVNIKKFEIDLSED